MKKFLTAVLILFVLIPFVARASDEKALLLNAFGETATAYLNDSFLLLGTTADGFVSEIIPRETALEIAKNAQRRVRVIRAKLRAISSMRMAEIDRQLIGLLDGAFACMDQQAWVLSQYVADKNPEAAKRFEQQRVSCLEKIGKIGEFYATLPPAPELPEPLSTR